MLVHSGVWHSETDYHAQVKSSRLSEISLNRESCMHFIVACRESVSMHPGNNGQLKLENNNRQNLEHVKLRLATRRLH